MGLFLGARHNFDNGESNPFGRTRNSQNLVEFSRVDEEVNSDSRDLRFLKEGIFGYKYIDRIFVLQRVFRVAKGSDDFSKGLVNFSVAFHQAIRVREHLCEAYSGF